MQNEDENPTPHGQLMLQALTLPADTNPSGDIYGGWLMTKMDLAGSISAQAIAAGRVTTVAVGSMVFLRPVPIGASVGFYVDVEEVGRSSIRTLVEAWIIDPKGGEAQKITEGEFVFVAIDGNGRTRPINRA
jgi:acyl-CoA thioesterase YciA